MPIGHPNIKRNEFYKPSNMPIGHPNIKRNDFYKPSKMPIGSKPNILIAI